MQHRRPNPLFSRIGCGAALLLALTLAALLYFRGGGPFSPGPLTAAQPRGETLAGFNAHAEFEADCGQCHAPWRGPEAARCEQCHENVRQQRTTQSGLHGRLADTGRCERCHTDHQGRDAQITQVSLHDFNHLRLTDFDLAQHAVDFDGLPLSCNGCHVAKRYTAEEVDCVTCHTEAEPRIMAEHQEQFGADCLACHDGSGRLVDFDHAQVFALDGAHATASCESCHRERVFAGTPRECAACHEEPAVHAGLFGLDCARCHTASAWTPARLTEHTFPLDHGSPSNLSCETCHTDSYTEYTCYNCHEHDPGEIREEHVEEGIRDFQDCVECHPTGREEEGEFDDD